MINNKRDHILPHVAATGNPHVGQRTQGETGTPSDEKKNRVTATRKEEENKEGTKAPKGAGFFADLSVLQKSIRRGLEKQALYWAIQLERYDYVMLWNRLEAITSEDIGLANPTLPATIDALRRQYEGAVQRRNGAYRLFLANAVLQMSRSPKSRVVDDYLWVVYCEVYYDDVRLEIPDYAKGPHLRGGRLQKWIEEGSRIENEAEDVPNPYKEQARKYLKEHRKLPKVFPKRPRRGKKKRKAEGEEGAASGASSSEPEQRKLDMEKEDE